MLTLDHLVILVHDLQRAVKAYERLGFCVTPGGIHADGLTHNALIVFSDGTYLELIAFINLSDQRDNVWNWRTFLPAGGLIDYCVISSDLATDVPRLRQRGLDVSDPQEGGRQRPDGVALRWRSARFRQQGRLLPFLIEDITPRSLRVPTATVMAHANGATGIDELIIAAEELEPAAALINALADVEPVFSQIDHQLDAYTATSQVGSYILRIATPRSEHSLLHHKLNQHGPGPFGYVLRLQTGGLETSDWRLATGS